MMNIFGVARNKWNDVNAPAGDANQLSGWANDAAMYSNEDRRYLYQDSSWLHSSRIACDARVSYMARQCYEGAFTEDQYNGNSAIDNTRLDAEGNPIEEEIEIPDWGGFLGGSSPFCATWSLQDLVDKCDDVGCASEYRLASGDIIDFNQRGQGRSFAEEALTLLIEDKLYEKDEDWETVVPAPYKNFIYVEKGCPVNCPTGHLVQLVLLL